MQDRTPEDGRGVVFVRVGEREGGRGSYDHDAVHCHPVKTHRVKVGGDEYDVMEMIARRVKHVY